MNKKATANEFTLARRSFSEGGRQMLDPNTPSINFEQVTTMLGEIQQTHKEVLSNMDSYGFGKDTWTQRFQHVIHSYNH